MPTQVGTDTNWQTIDGGGNHSVALKQDNSVWAWGQNGQYQLGNGDNNFNFNYPIEVNCSSLGIASFDQHSFFIYPNPSTEVLNIQTPNNLQIDSRIFFDIYGKKVLQDQQNSNSINIQNLSSGLYILQITADGKTFQSKFIKP